MDKNYPQKSTDHIAGRGCFECGCRTCREERRLRILDEYARLVKRKARAPMETVAERHSITKQRVSQLIQEARELYEDGKRLEDYS